jgi:hypothetical protein
MPRNRAQVSISGVTYARLKTYATEHDLAISSIVEQAIAPALGQDPPPLRAARRYRGTRHDQT